MSGYLNRGPYTVFIPGRVANGSHIAEQLDHRNLSYRTHLPSKKTMTNALSMREEPVLVWDWEMPPGPPPITAVIPADRAGHWMKEQLAPFLE